MWYLGDRTTICYMCCTTECSQMYVLHKLQLDIKTWDITGAFLDPYASDILHDVLWYIWLNKFFKRYGKITIFNYKRKYYLRQHTRYSRARNVTMMAANKMQNFCQYSKSRALSLTPMTSSESYSNPYPMQFLKQESTIFNIISASSASHHLSICIKISVYFN